MCNSTSNISKRRVSYSGPKTEAYTSTVPLKLKDDERIA